MMFLLNSKIMCNRLNIHHSWLYGLIVWLIACGFGGSNHAYGLNSTGKKGVVMARTVILKDGIPVLVEYKPDGQVVVEGSKSAKIIPLTDEQKANFGQLVIMSVTEFRMEQHRYDKYMESRADDLAQGAELMSKEEFEQTDFKAADGKTSIVKPTLKTHVKSVLVRGQSNRVVPVNHNGSWEPLVLLSFGVDFSKKKLEMTSGTLLLDGKGQIIHSTQNNIGPLTGFFGDLIDDPNKIQVLRAKEDKIHGAVRGGLRVFGDTNMFPGSMTATDDTGKYSMRFVLPYCPGGADFRNDIWAEIQYADFNPNTGAETIPYYIRRQDWTYCYDPFPFAGGSLAGAMAYVNVLATAATLAAPDYNLDFKIDVMFLVGKVFLKNPDNSEITVGTTTEYYLDAPTTTKTATWYDFDGDGKQDKSVVGIIKPEPQEDGTVKNVFEQQPGGQYQAVYFSSHVKPDGSPDVIRLADVKKNLKSNGLLKSISLDDLRDTDILVFRESTGQLVLERNGLTEKELQDIAKTDPRNLLGHDTGVEEGEEYFYYRVMLRGPTDSKLNVGGGPIRTEHTTWEDWAKDYQMTEPFQKRDADHLKPGEWIRLVIINRVTGYAGTQRVLLGDASKNNGNMLNVQMDDTYLMPPNLKIWAERDYKHEYGLDKGTEKHNSVIGMEGASTTDDERIKVFTEWYDEEGRPLPEGLGNDNGEQFGLTGRLARVTSENKIDKASDAANLAEFPIKPGSHMQVLREKSNLTSADHFYIHVIGTQLDKEHSFESAPMASDNRPKNSTPFLVPLNDENADWKNWSAWNQLKRAYDAEQLEEEPLKPRANYSWHYRPEYQFSQISLDVESIIRSYTDEAGKTNEQELLFEQEGEGKVPTIRGNDDLVTVFYSLIANNYNRLSPLEGEQEYIFGLGANEIKATIGQNGEIRFDNLEHIDYLDPTDLLSIRLYVNHDAANTLWEWAFTRNGLHVYYEVPGNTQAKSKRALPTISDVNCNNQICTDIEILALLAKEEPTPPVAIPEQPDPKVRTLGGMRLRLRYIPPSLDGLKVEKVTWKIGHRGRYCNRYGVDSVACETKEANDPYEQKQPTGPIIVVNETGDWSVYWEPVKKDEGDKDVTDWSNWAGTQTTDHGVDSELKAEYTIPTPGNNINDNPIAARAPRHFEQKFTFNTRELKPATGTEEPMKGSDVAMLEAILWQFGISPQYGYPGYAGTRLGEHSASLGGIVGGDVGRDTFSKGSGGAKGAGSLEKMMIRFNSRLFETTEDALKGATSTKGAVLDTASLGAMGKLWKDYYRAVRQYAEGFFTQGSLVDENWSAFSNAMVGNVAFKSPDKNDTLDISYDDSTHQLAMTAIGGAANRTQLLKAWASKENDRHWGVGKSAYRISEGGADEVGSIGFSQIWFSYVYGKASRCSKIKGVNMYHPQNNLLGFAVWVGAKGCGGSFYKAFNTTDYDVAVDTVTANKLRGYMCTNAQGQPSVCTYQVDHYERLMKGLIGYNAGASADRLLNCSLAEMLAGGVTRGGVNCQSTRSQGKGFDYGLTILHGKMPGDEGGADSRFLTLPHRTFVWVGERYPANLKLEDGITPDPRAGTPKWCFKYGEKEWRELVSWDDAKRRARGDALALPPIQPIGRTNCD